MTRSGRGTHAWRWLVAAAVCAAVVATAVQLARTDGDVTASPTRAGAASSHEPDLPGAGGRSSAAAAAAPLAPAACASPPAITTTAFKDPEVLPEPAARVVEPSWARGGVRVTVVDGASQAPQVDVDVWYLDLDADAARGHLRPIDPDLADVRDVVRGYGRRFRTDQQGAVSVPPPAHSARIFAEASGASGWAAIEPATTNATVTLAAVRFFNVLVVHEDGRPVAGVAVWAASTADDVLDHGPAGRLSDASGLAHFRLSPGYAPAPLVFPEPDKPGDKPPDDGPVRLQVRLDCPVRDVACIDIRDRELLSAAPTRLVLPACGSVTVRFPDLPAAVRDGSCVVCLSSYDTPSYYSMRSAIRKGTRRGQVPSDWRKITGEAVTFPAVEVGLAVRAWVMDTSDVLAVGACAGPQRDGDHVVVDLAVACPVIRGRIVDATGRPVASRAMYVMPYVGDPLRTSVSMQLGTGADGVFRCSWIQGWQKDERHVLSLGLVELATECSTFGGCELPAHLEAREYGVGDIVIRPVWPFLVGGTIVCSDGTPAAGAYIEAVDAEQPWSSGCRAAVTARADGTFQLYGEAGNAALRLRVNYGGDTVACGVAFECGCTDMRLVIEKAGSIEGSVVLPPGVWNHYVQVHLYATRDGVGNLPAAGADRRLPGITDANGGFAIDRVRVPAGEYTLEVRYFDGRESLAEVRGLVVPPGGVARDLRIQPLDLRGALKTVTLTVVDLAGKPLPPGAGAAFLTASGQQTWSWTLDRNAPMELVVPTRGADVKVWSDGFQPVVLSALKQSTRVVLTPE